MLKKIMRHDKLEDETKIPSIDWYQPTSLF